LPVVDERSAGFFALGIGKASGRPAAVITTSGTAAANLFPAVIEASQGEVPLLVLTADRPHRLRDTDGNQAMDQLRLFGVFPRGFFEVSPPAREGRALRHLRGQAVRAIALATGGPPGPVHVNFPFEKPFEPGDDVGEGEAAFALKHPLAARGRVGREPFTRVSQGRTWAGVEELDSMVEALAGVSRGLIVAGPSPRAQEDGASVRALASATGFPVLADPLSGARFGPPEGARVVGGYDLFLRAPEAVEALRPELVVRVGASPTSASLLAYLAEHQACEQIVVDGGFRWKDHLASAHRYYRVAVAPFLGAVAGKVAEAGAPPQPGASLWLERWIEAEARTKSVLDTHSTEEVLEGRAVAAVVEAMPADSTLMVSNSMPVRDLDAFGHPMDKTLRVFGNRGVSGIDGIVSTALGLRWALEKPTAAILGDLALFHDMNGLLAARTQSIPVVFVVLNNDGGGIFHSLPVRSHEPAFTRFFATPHGLDFQRTAELYGLDYARVRDLDSLREATVLAMDRENPSLVEMRTDRDATHRARAEVVAAVGRAMEGFAV
jgi:2-succinyl-5-enolpyruvyl-6-hydroxy-3-cyclohexene-1-carboxylate synthase